LLAQTEREKGERGWLACPQGRGGQVGKGKNNGKSEKRNWGEEGGGFHAPGNQESLPTECYGTCNGTRTGQTDSWKVQIKEIG